VGVCVFFLFMVMGRVKLRVSGYGVNVVRVWVWVLNDFNDDNVSRSVKIRGEYKSESTDLKFLLLTAFDFLTTRKFRLTLLTNPR